MDGETNSVSHCPPNPTQHSLTPLLPVLSHWGQEINIGLNFIPFQQLSWSPSIS